MLHELVQNGLYEAIDKGLFPNLYDTYPDFMITQLLDAMGVRMSVLHRVLRNSSGDSDTQKGVLAEMGFVRRSCADVGFTRRGQGLEIMEPLTFMYNEEREGLKAMVQIGAYEAINPINYPGLSAINHEVIGELQAEALNSRIGRLEGILGNFQKRDGFIKDQPDNPLVTEVLSRIKALRILQRQILSVKRLEVDYEI